KTPRTPRKERDKKQKHGKRADDLAFLLFLSLSVLGVLGVLAVYYVLLLELRREVRVELGHLRGDDHLAVALIGIVPEIALVIILGAIERLEGNHLCHQRNAPGS